ncbi:Ribosomal protein S6--L-glutamate ligase [Planctomycetes bacterium MalM25]|nr:Ribosomal protein S6--L-glutamate ligase [Planctomycetes bacterium MalM25]
MAWIAWPSELRESGILGINRRNLSYIMESNPRCHYPRVDNKLRTKEICEEHGIPVPETYGVLYSIGDVRGFPEMVKEIDDFVIKPACGAAGRGVMVIAEHVGDVFVTPSGNGLRWSEVRYHLSTVISGLHSLGGRPDHAIIEKRIVTHPALDTVSVGGTPDIRVILYRGVPVMAMLRLPTHASGGRANLHQGAIAAAVDLSTGRTYGGVCQNRVLDEHPDTRQPIAGIEMPDWQRLLDSAMRLGDALELGYLGVDFVIDAENGPVILEANARPGLAIQVANRAGLRPRLERIEALSEERITGESRWQLIEEMGTAPSDL